MLRCEKRCSPPNTTLAYQLLCLSVRDEADDPSVILARVPWTDCRQGTRVGEGCPSLPKAPPAGSPQGGGRPHPPTAETGPPPQPPGQSPGERPGREARAPGTTASSPPRHSAGMLARK